MESQTLHFVKEGELVYLYKHWSLAVLEGSVS